MARPRALVLRTAGINCDEETEHALNLAGADARRVHLNRVVADRAAFDDAGLLVLPGGFSYGDDVASGKVLAVEIATLLADRIAAFIERGGLLLGICNGFQVLVKTGFLPYAKACAAEQRDFTLAHNDSRKFESRWVRLRAPADTKCVWVEPGEEIELPVAHGEGKWVPRQPEALKRLAADGLVAYRYVAADGSDAPEYPDNPNGSAEHIAGVCDPSGRIFGLMPHPERHIFPWHHPRHTRTGHDGEGDGMRLFRRAVKLLS